MQRKFKSRKESKSVPSYQPSSSLNSPRPYNTRIPTHPIKPKQSHSKRNLQPPKLLNCEYFGYATTTQSQSMTNRSSSRRLSDKQVPSTCDEKSLPSAKAINSITSRIHLMREDINLKTARILNLKLDKAFMEIEVLNNQLHLHKVEKKRKGSYALETIYNMGKEIESLKKNIDQHNSDYDSWLVYQRFMDKEMAEDSSEKEETRDLPQYSSKEKVSTEFLNAVEELRMLQLSLDKHNQIYEPYIVKLKKDIELCKESIGDKEEKIKGINEVIFAQYGRRIRRTKESSVESKSSKGSYTKRRNEVQTFYCGNLVAKNRSKIISDRKLLDKADVTFSGLRILFDSEVGFSFQCQYTDDHGETCEGEIHSPGVAPDLTQTTCHRVSSIQKIRISFHKKLNTIMLSLRNGTCETLGIHQGHVEEKQLSLEDKLLRCISTYWLEGVLVGLGVEYEKRKLESPLIMQAQLPQRIEPNQYCRDMLHTNKYECDLRFYDELQEELKQLEMWDEYAEVGRVKDQVLQIKEMTVRHARSLDEDDTPDEKEVRQMAEKLRQVLIQLDTSSISKVVDRINTTNGSSITRSVLEEVSKEESGKYTETVAKMYKTVHNPQTRTENILLVGMFYLVNSQNADKIITTYRNLIDKSMEELKQFKPLIAEMPQEGVQEVLRSQRFGCFVEGTKQIFLSTMKLYDVFRILSGQSNYKFKLGNLRAEINQSLSHLNQDYSTNIELIQEDSLEPYKRDLKEYSEYLRSKSEEGEAKIRSGLCSFCLLPGDLVSAGSKTVHRGCWNLIKTLSMK